MKDEWVYLNGAFVPHAEARVSVEDRGFNFADGIYEVVRLVGGRLFRIPAHLERLGSGAAALEIGLPAPLAELGDTMRETAARNAISEGYVYLQLTRGTAPRSHRFPEDVRPTLVVLARPFAGRSSQEWDRGVSVVTAPDIRWGLCGIKTIGLLPNVLAQQRAARAGAYEAILVRDGVVTEGAHTSVFAVIDQTVLTHPLDNILPGITRRSVIDSLSAAGLEVVERPVGLDEFRGADEVFLTGTTTEVLGVVEVDGRRVGAGRPGPITRRALEFYREAVESVRRG